MNTFIRNTLLLLFVVLGLMACNDDEKFEPVVSNVMELNKEYLYTDQTKITNIGATALVVTKKHYWDENKTVVILVEGNATIN